MNDKVSSAQELLYAIEWVHEGYKGTGRNGLEEGAKLSGEISEILVEINSTLSEGWANIASTVLKFNNSAESFMEDFPEVMYNILRPKESGLKKGCYIWLLLFYGRKNSANRFRMAVCSSMSLKIWIWRSSRVISP